MFRYNPKANYQPNGGRYLQVLSGKDLYKQTIVMSKDGTFPVRFPNIFVDYPLGQMRVGDKFWTHWNKAPIRLWQTQLNFAVWCVFSMRYWHSVQSIIIPHGARLKSHFSSKFSEQQDKITSKLFDILDYFSLNH